MSAAERQRRRRRRVRREQRHAEQVARREQAHATARVWVGPAVWVQALPCSPLAPADVLAQQVVDVLQVEGVCTLDELRAALARLV